MTNWGSHPAVFAGLLGGASWGAPTWAYAVPLDQVSSLTSNSLVVQFLLGCMTGATVAGVTIGAMSLVKNHREQAMEDDGHGADASGGVATPIVLNADESPWTSSSLSLVRAQLKAEEDDPTGSLKRMRTGQITLELSDREHELSQASAQPEAPRRARHAAADPSSAVTQVIVRRFGRHFAQADPVNSVAPTSRSAGKHATPKHAAHASADPVAAPAEPDATVPSVDLPVVETPALGEAARASLADLPTIDSRRSMLAAATTSAAMRSRAERMSAIASMTDLSSRALGDDDPLVMAVTDNRRTLRERIAMRTKNVREVLAERLSPEAMETIPQIRRGDGSIDQITPTWFDQNVVPTLASFAAKINENGKAAHGADAFGDTMLMGTVPMDLLSATIPAIPTPASALSGVSQLAAAGEHESRASYISTRIAGVDLGMFPERRDAAALEHEDVFEQALAAMAETIRQEAPVFEDMVGGPSTIDDPDGLEGPTTLIPFRKRSRRPLVMDPAAYVDSLIDDEVSRGKREAARARRHSKHAYLRVIEGGTSPLRLRAEGSDHFAVAHGRHFAPSRYAAEA